ncbi:MAG: DUF4349 domain-containing protein [Chloroflexota bacterium]|nr:DUF4349 domain-containing protein [Chloroflexota bacterium]
MRPHLRWLLTLVALATLSLLAACGPAATPTATPWPGGGFDMPSASGIPTPTPTRAPSFPTATPAPRPAATPTATPRPGQPPPPTPTPPAGQVAYQPGSAPAQERIIVRTVDATLVVDDVTQAMDSIGAVARQMGGWVVSSSQSQRHAGAISVRVPAQRLDEALSRLRDLAVKVESLNATSQDFTDEYSDTQARVRNLQATEDALIGFLAKAQNVEEALKVQVELTKVQGQIEQLQGRLGFLEQSSAYSLVNVQLKLVGMSMSVDAGPDLTVKEGEPISFRASFTPPEGITSFTYEWDFGDETPTIGGSRTAPEPASASRATATVTRVYRSSEQSPFIVTVKVRGSGDAGAAEGMDTLIVKVVKVKPIEVYAGPDVTVKAGDTVTFDGSFTRPVGFSDLRLAWDFGDGSAPASSSVPEGATTTTVTHVYQNYRPAPFFAILTISATSEAGPVEASDSVQVSVRSKEAIAGSWNPGGTAKSSARALVTIGQALGTLLIWLGIFLPLWGAIVALAVFLGRRSRRAHATRPRRSPPEPDIPEGK